MSSARIELFSDGDAPKATRYMPAALEGSVAPESWSLFCDKLDDSLAHLFDAQKQRGRKIMGYMFVPYFALIFSSLVFRTEDPGRTWSILGLATLASWIAVYFWTRRGPNALSAKEAIQKLRSDCEEMTEQTPHVSFHVVMVSLTMGNKFGSQMVEHIAVSLAPSVGAAAAAAGTVVHNGAVELSDLAVATVVSADVSRAICEDDPAKKKLEAEMV